MGGRADIAVGNVVGSNIFNVLFILGLSALVTPLVVNAQLIRQEVPIMVGVSCLLVVLSLDATISRVDAVVMLSMLVAYTAFLVVQSRSEAKATLEEYEAEVRRVSKGGWKGHWATQSLLVVAGLVLLVAGSNRLVEAAVAFARVFGVSDLVIGLTIVAAGTSLPEVATSVTAAIKGERDIAVGNVVGSNTFNILGCLGMSGLASPAGLPVAQAALNFDLWVMLAVAVACLPVFFTGREIARWEGGVFLGYYVAYTGYLVLAAQRHDLLPAFSAVMLWFVIPLTIVTLAVVLVRSFRAAA
jgi:cation:H+ antiporter